MVGKNPIVLVGTKLDLLPEGTHPKDVAEWLTEAVSVGMAHRGKRGANLQHGIKDNTWNCTTSL